MALTSGIIKLSGTIDGFTFVNSKYGRHIRRARGTVKKASLNSVLQKNSERTKIISKSGSEIYEEIKEISGKFKEGQLWQKMIARMMRAGNTNIESLLNTLIGMEINSAHSVDALQTGFEISPTLDKKSLIVNLNYKQHPNFKNPPSNNYFFEVFLTRWIKGKADPLFERVPTDLVSFNDKLWSFEFEFTRQKNTKYQLMVLKVCSPDENGYEYVGYTGMKIIGASSI